MREQTVFLVLGLLLLGGAAHAQTPNAQTPPAGEMCDDHFAAAAGRLAFIEVKLGLTAAQRPLWLKWHDTAMAGAQSERAVCLEDIPKPGNDPSALDREANMEKRLSAKLQALHAAQPALAALYQGLTPGQRAIFDGMAEGKRR